MDIFNPFLTEPDPEAGEEDDEDAIRARAPQDLDARLPAPGGEAVDASHREDVPPMEAILPDLALVEASHREDVPPMEDMLLNREDDEPEAIIDHAWLLVLGKWSKHVSSEIAKQVVTVIMLAPNVEGYTTRGVTVTSVPVGKVAQFITSRHHVPSQAEWRRVAVQLREEDQWNWTGPLEHWAAMPHPNL